MAVGQNQWYHFGVGAPPILVYFSGDWDVPLRVRDFDPWPGQERQVAVRASPEVLTRSPVLLRKAAQSEGFVSSIFEINHRMVHCTLAVLVFYVMVKAPGSLHGS